MVRLRSRFLLLAGFAVAAHAQVVVWDGDNLDNNFSNAANWDSGALPLNDGTEDLKLVGYSPDHQSQCHFERQPGLARQQ
jgi:hypothetical protein